jgi:hypothetical protein
MKNKSLRKRGLFLYPLVELEGVNTVHQLTGIPCYPVP